MLNNEGHYKGLPYISTSQEKMTFPTYQ